MATLREIKRRIDSVKSTQQITKAMKMVAAAKLRKAQQQLGNSRPFSDELKRVVHTLAGQASAREHPYLKKRPPKRICYVLITADRGLCGSFNSNLIRTAEEQLAKAKNKNVTLLTIGKKGFDFFRHSPTPLAGKYIEFFNRLSFHDAIVIADALIEKYEQNTFDRIFILYNQFQSLVQQKIKLVQFLPIPILRADLSVSAPAIFEPQPQKILDELLPMSLRYKMYQLLLESFTAEQGARMTAMETASDNAEEMIRNLVLFYNKARQTAITTELNEIVSGAEALKG